MLKQNGGGICDHEVGTGNTLILCFAGHEMKRLNLAHKPMIIGLKANVAEIAATYQAAYPNARILYASETVSYTHLDVYKRQAVVRGYAQPYGREYPHLLRRTRVDKHLSLIHIS